nr:centromere protein J [Onthophagus taurus]
MNSNILARLEELKKWQSKQQERLQTSRKVSQFEDDLKEIESISIQETPIGTRLQKSTQKSIESNQHRNCNESMDSPIIIDEQHDKRKPKREFLKRGSGLVRYKMTQEDSKKPYGKKISIQKNKKCEIKNDDDMELEINIDIHHQNIEEVVKCDKNIASPLKLPSDYEIKLDDEMNSLKIAQDILIKQTILNINEIAGVKMINTNEDDINPLRNNHNQCEVSDETLLNERELLIFEALEEKILNSSFSSTNSSILKILSSTPNKLKSLKNERDDKIDQFEKEIIEESSFCSSLSSETSQKSELETENETKSVCCEDESRTISTSDSKGEESTLEDETSWNEITLSENKTEGSNSNNDEILMKKLKILDEEIEKFRRENATLQQKRFEIDRELGKLGKDKRMFEKYVLEEKVKVEFYLEEEKKAFAKEKLMFERYVKDVQSRTNRKEREEIIQLKDELATVKEAAKLKDRRNATSQARLRNQLKNYEKDIGRLKDEIDTLRKQNAKIINEQRMGTTLRKKTESKVLQEINKNLSKLAKENKVVIQEKEENNNQNNKEICSERIIVETPEDLDRKARELVDENLLKTYEEVFGNHNELNESKNNSIKDESKNVSKNDSLKSTKTERILDDGSKETKYSNGNIKTISADGNLVTMNYFNGDQKEINNINGTVKYFYAENESMHTTFPDGTEIIEFKDGQIETKRSDGSYEIKHPDGIVKVTRPDKSEDLSYPDGMRVNISCDGDKEIMFANGQKEIHTKDHMRREYLDGTVKIIYPDGIQETRYSNGRIRIKDKNGKLLLDSHEGNT